jgi:hypothetical protein
MGGFPPTGRVAGSQPGSRGYTCGRCIWCWGRGRRLFAGAGIDPVARG